MKPTAPPTMLPPVLTLMLPGDVPLEMRLIPACPEGFLMGSRGYDANEEPRHRVIIAQPFYLGTYPVTQAQFAAFDPTHENHFKDKPDHPAENLDWYQAEQFAPWVKTQARGLPAGLEPCLPSEAQWEYACRAGMPTEYHRGDGEAALREVGWFGENWGTGSTHAVGGLKPNAFGLHDMHGNVWEWCADVWDAHAYAKRADGWSAEPWTVEMAGEDAQFEASASTEHALRVVRGGSWVLTPWWCRSACRSWGGPRSRFWLRGFRLCLSSGLVVQAQAKTGAEPRAGAGREGRRQEGRLQELRTRPSSRTGK